MGRYLIKMNEYYIFMSYFLIIFTLNSITIANGLNETKNATSVNCTILRSAFAEAASEFTLCAVYNSRPITLCNNCVERYIDVLHSYHNMSLYKDNNTKCIDYFINLDRLQIVETLYEYANNLWSKAKCYQCFQFDHGELTPYKSNETVTFNEYNQKFQDCITKRKEPSDICIECLDSYLVLNSYYLSISNHNDKIGVCMDIVDNMNNTWAYWSSTCCEYRKHDESLFIAATVVVFVITIAFYILSQWCSKKEAPTIMHQTRFAASINNLTT